MTSLREQHISLTLDTLASTIEDVGINHGSADILMAQQLLDGADIIA